VFSRRLPWDRPENALALLERARRAAGGALLDLTESNPTRVGLPYPVAEIRDALAAAEVATYAPAPRGLPNARAAVAASYGDLGARVGADRLLLTASSSESYAFLFKTLCDPGDAVLVPEPSYPLFEYLARLEGVTPLSYRLAFDGVWHIDFASVAARLDETASAGARGPRLRALVLVSPNNPTGSFLKRAEIEPLARAATAGGLAIISDEVFAGYAFAPDPDRVTVAAAEPALAERVLTFSLGGLSKLCGMPQLKLGWLLAGGPPPLLRAALERLELVADTYLSAGTPVQLAAPRLLAAGAGVRRAIADRIAGNRAQLAAAISRSSPCTLLASEGGWSAIMRVPATRSDEDWAATLLAEDGVLVHPGYFFDMHGGAFLVLSLLPPPETFGSGVARLLARCDEASSARSSGVP
jgi:aspartate/methionine/tyrosine aminotransferase